MKSTSEGSPMDRERVANKLDDLEQYLWQIDKYLPSSFDDYVEDELLRRGLERFLHLAIERL
jgi:uncharacterized protein YutE (UPF0331/DUF86 family)